MLTSGTGDRGCEDYFGRARHWPIGWGEGRLLCGFSGLFAQPCLRWGVDVEVEAHGDMMRRGLPQSNGMGSAFTSMNRNKSLCLDLQKPG